MYYHIKELVKFIRNNDNSELYKHQSNTQLRSYIRACLHKKSFYFVTRGPKLIGIIEWYRIKNNTNIFAHIHNKKYLNSNISGNIIYIHNAIFIPKYLTVKILKRFQQYHKNITHIVWWRMARKKFKIINTGLHHTNTRRM